MSARDPLLATIGLLRPRLPRLLLAIALGVLALGSALALAGVSAWLITRAWQMPPVLDLTVAVVAVRALAISRGVFGYCERLASHDTALRAAGNARAGLYDRLANGSADAAMRLHSGDLVARVGASVDELADVLVRAVLPISVAAVLGLAAVTVIAVISPAAAVVLAACLLIAGVLAPWLAARAVTAAEAVAVQHHSERDIATMLALEHAPELRVSGRLDEVIAESERQHRDWGHASRSGRGTGRPRRRDADRRDRRERARRRRGRNLAGILGCADHRRDPDVVAVVGFRGDHGAAGRRGPAHPVTASRPAGCSTSPSPAKSTARARRFRMSTWSRATDWWSPAPAARARPRC